MQRMLVVNEAGLFQIISTVRASTYAFRRWVQNDILPSVRAKVGDNRQVLAPMFTIDVVSSLRKLEEASDKTSPKVKAESVSYVPQNAQSVKRGLPQFISELIDRLTKLGEEAVHSGSAA